MKNCIIKFKFDLPSIATKEDILYANIEFMIDAFGEYFNIKIRDSLLNDKYYYFIINSHNSFTEENIKNLINNIKNTNNCYNDITYSIFYDEKENNNLFIGINNNYSVIKGILNQIVEV